MASYRRREKRRKFNPRVAITEGSCRVAKAAAEFEGDYFSREDLRAVCALRGTPCSLKDFRMAVSRGVIRRWKSGYFITLKGEKVVKECRYPRYLRRLPSYMRKS